ncbi:MAG: NAD(P)-dependent oxidoreductase [Actinobacteria bacterium]|nr:NAD(P)-dependent oxidoreductase [Actinomycetota bacterium]
MNILISGGGGYIGNFLAKLLIEQGHNIGLIIRRENEFTRIYKNYINLYFADVIKPLVFSPDKSYNLFVHLAAANDIDSFDPYYAINSTVLGTKNSLTYCKNHQIKRFLYFSTFQVFGHVEGNMYEESPFFPVNDYGITHLFAEQYVQMYNRLANINFIIIRPTNIFGAPMFKEVDRWTLVPSCFCKEAIEKGEINLMSSGIQTRDFVDVNDLASLSALYCNEFDLFTNSIVNISSGNIFSIIEIAEIVADIYQSTFNKPCKINIHSESPKEKNIFSIDKSQVNKTGFRFGSKNAIKTEINKIFKLLEE